jgi:exodeoxyribonuclease V alpha subunit
LIPTTTQLMAAGLVSRLDHYFARFISRLAAGDPEQEDMAMLTMAAAMVSAHTSGGHVCLPLEEIAGKPVVHDTFNPDEQPEVGKQHGRDKKIQVEQARQELIGLVWPHLTQWESVLRGSEVVGTGESPTPLVLDGAQRLYLHRYWEYEQRLIHWLRERIEAPPIDVDSTWLKAALTRLFPPEPEDEDDPAAIDWRKLAALIVLSRRFAVISGGPGTGKTTAVIKLLVLLIEQAQQAGKQLRIAMLAPTGKAAARLQESVDHQREQLKISEDVRAALPREGSTIHRRLGAYGGGYVYGPDNRLPYDVVVVDEASMVDVVLISRLTMALEDKARLVLLGDRDQLASVQAGAVMGDLCRLASDRGYSSGLRNRFAELTGGKLPKDEVGDSETGIGDLVVQLRRNFRFNAESGIGALAARIVAGDADGTISVLADPASPGVSLLAPAESERLGQMVAKRWGRMAHFSEPDVAAAFSVFLEFRILCAHRKGIAGAVLINRDIEGYLVQEGLCPGGSEWYRGRPVMVTRNDYTLRLYNGDVGLTWPDADGVLVVHFPDGQGGFRTFLPARLPEHETVYAMTVHKSQGSEFGRVLLVLPEVVSAVLTREMIYTGVTRAKDEVLILGAEAVLREAVAVRVVRRSGLVDGVGGLNF